MKKKVEKVVLGYVTAKDKDEGLRLARHLVEKRVVGCVNILPGMQSIYRWEGKIEESQEVVVILKTAERLKERVLEAIQQHHSYACPCVLFLNVDSGNPEYLDWLTQSVS